MQTKWGFLSAISALLTAIIALATFSIDATVLSIIFSVITVVACSITVFVINKVHGDHESSAVAHKTKHTESISTAFDHEGGDENEIINRESATKVEPDIDKTHHDEESGLLSESFFPVYLEQRITAARRTLRPVSLVIFELDGLDKNDSNSPSDRNFYISAVGDVVKRTLRESDCAFRISENIFAAVMDDTTESGAVWAAERVRGVLHTGALAGRVTVSAGVACYPSHVLEPDELIESANKALEIAKARGVDQVEIAAEQ